MECNSCGATIDRRDAFCAKCGTLTERGQPIGQKIGSVVGALTTESGKLLRWIIDYVSDEAHRKQVIAGGATIALLLVVLTDNPLTDGISSLLAGEGNSPELTDDGLPDFASYEDVFVGDEEEFIVMGAANVRDFPTSQGTTVTHTFAGGETIFAREVKAFDPTSQWFKLTSGGYVWGGNLEGLAQIAHEAGYSFPNALVGRWSNHASCVGSGRDTELELTIDTLNIGATRYGMVNILAAGEEIPVYELVELRNGIADGSGLTVQKDARYPAIWISYKNDPTEKAYRYYRSDYLCSDVRAIAQLGTGM